MCHCVLAVSAFAALATSASAQTGNIRSVTIYTVKPERVSDFQAEIKQYIAIEAKGGSGDYYSMWLSLTGPRTYVLASYHKTWSELDRVGGDPKMKEQAADLTRIGLRITDCTESYRRVFDEINPDLSLPDSEKIPTMIRVLTTEVRPDRYLDYIALIKSDVLPGMKKSGQSFSIGESRFGAPGSTVTSVVGFNNWADIDGTIGLEKGIGKEAYRDFLKKLRPLVISTQSDIYRFQPDLSYLPQAAK
jgi:hypothetical protein